MFPRIDWQAALKRGALAFAVLSSLAGPSLAAPCGDDGAGFSAWLNDFKTTAAAQGISPRTISAALDGAQYDTSVIRLDRNQKHFAVSFEQFIAGRVTAGRISQGKAKLKQYADVLARIERQFGVPGPILVAIWGMETDYGANQGKKPVFPSLATLAYDCRRSDFFTEQLLYALRIADRGYLAIGDMRGAWAGEMGQTQFMPKSYYQFAVDFDGNGRPDLIRSAPDVLASTANYLKNYGWSGMSWENGANRAALAGWNKAAVYQQAIAYFASKLVN
ncbi:lytic murein transglycosylase [Ancylobacter sp. 6x-1]|uniref:Lytic murein transglycosylase n=1 Tax=Ancylobacter crimeensis TaxID=2579147 RepID=A0ABT0DA42_9HYPH|nr:lytic murein transglycosylase [Ancylobacter crimeensis]MCK0196825.1 lytic murein transglycosylase [Ancylobacter crimeensis]